MTPEREGSYVVPLLVDGEEREAEVRWFVVPTDGLWVRWRGEVELTWPNGDRKTLWRGHSRDRARLIRRTLRRVGEWATVGTDHTRTGETDG